MYKKFEDAYRLHVLPILKSLAQEYHDDSQGSFDLQTVSMIDAGTKVSKELKLSKELKEVQGVLTTLLGRDTLQKVTNHLLTSPPGSTRNRPSIKGMERPSIKGSERQSIKGSERPSAKGMDRGFTGFTINKAL